MSTSAIGRELRRSMKRSGPLPMLAGGVLIVAVLITLLVEGGWLI